MKRHTTLILCVFALLATTPAKAETVESKAAKAVVETKERLADRGFFCTVRMGWADEEKQNTWVTNVACHQTKAPQGCQEWHTVTREIFRQKTTHNTTSLVKADLTGCGSKEDLLRVLQP